MAAKTPTSDNITQTPTATRTAHLGEGAVEAPVTGSPMFSVYSTRWAGESRKRVGHRTFSRPKIFCLSRHHLVVCHLRKSAKSADKLFSSPMTTKDAKKTKERRTGRLWTGKSHRKTRRKRVARMMRCATDGIAHGTSPASRGSGWQPASRSGGDRRGARDSARTPGTMITSRKPFARYGDGKSPREFRRSRAAHGANACSILGMRGCST